MLSYWALSGKANIAIAFHRESDAQGGRCWWKGIWQPDSRSLSAHLGHSHPQLWRHELQDACLASVTATIFSQCFCQIQDQVQRDEEVNCADDWSF